jgi:hypothetical protein
MGLRAGLDTEAGVKILSDGVIVYYHSIYHHRMLAYKMSRATDGVVSK